MKTVKTKKKSFLTAMAIVCAAVAAVILATAKTANSNVPIKVGTYNIRLVYGDKGSANEWDKRKSDLVSLVKKLDLDVFGMQEVCPEQAAYFRNELSDWEFCGEHREADRVSGEASPVFFRKSRFTALDKGTFWLSETPDVPASKSWGTACTRVCSYLILKDKMTNKTFCFANAHTDHVSALAREKGMLLIIERMKKFGHGSPIVFTGDHNCEENEKPALAVSKLLSNALYASETPPQGPWRTYNGWKWLDKEISCEEALKLPVPERKRRIDYIYVSKGIRVLDYKTIGKPRPETKLYPSDHFPVVATIVL